MSSAASIPPGPIFAEKEVEERISREKALLKGEWFLWAGSDFFFAA